MPLLEVPLATRLRISRSREVRGRPLRDEDFGALAGEAGRSAAGGVGVGAKRSLLAESKRARALGSSTMSPASTAAKAAASDDAGMSD